jgi:Na+/melibiose symporter-like transporter
MLFHNLIRNHYSEETASGERALIQHESRTLRATVWPDLRLIAAACRVGTFRRIIVLYVFSALALQINIFQAVYLTESVKLSPVLVGVVPAVGALGALVCYLFVMPWADSTQSIGARVAWSSVLTCVGWSAFLFVELPGGRYALIFAAILIGAGPFLLESYRDALVIGSVPEEQRASIFASVQTVTAVVTIPAGILSASLYGLAPRALFLAILALYFVSFLGTLKRGIGDEHEIGLSADRPAIIVV